MSDDIGHFKAMNLEGEWLGPFFKDLHELCSKYETEQGIDRYLLLGALAQGVGKLMPTIADYDLMTVEMMVNLNIQMGFNEVAMTIAQLTNPQGRA